MNAVGSSSPTIRLVTDGHARQTSSRRSASVRSVAEGQLLLEPRAMRFPGCVDDVVDAGLVLFGVGALRPGAAASVVRLKRLCEREKSLLEVELSVVERSEVQGEHWLEDLVVCQPRI